MAAQNMSTHSDKESASEKEAAVTVVSNGSRVGAPEGPPAERSFQRITLERIDPNLFLAKPENLWKPVFGRAIYGGQVLGQAVAAASQTVHPGLSLHSLHGYFVRGGQPQHPIVYDIKRIRDGASFSTRGVAAKQDGEWIFTMQASFHKPEFASLDQQAFMPSVPDPETLPTQLERLEHFISEIKVDPEDKQQRDFMQLWLSIARSQRQQGSPVDTRPVLDHWNFSTGAVEQESAKQALASFGMPTNIVWFRASNPLPDDEYVHHAVLAYQSDAGLLTTARSKVPMAEFAKSKPMMASLDHSMWFHLPFPRWRADEWLLYVTYSPRVTGARALAHGHIYTREGLLVVSCSQEGLIRLGTDRDAAEANSKL
mmetsp:Transcript_133316/g.231608  ORF Transcript_133316/g.231608 Transcript_133316/m.231608 type:complete len:370 (+) Transcript_133316:43-1152(+)